MALRARDERGPTLRMQLLVYPVTNHDFATASYQENGDGYLLTQDMMKWFWDHYLNGAHDSKKAVVSPLQADDLSGLPRTFVLTGEFDPLRDEGEAYAHGCEPPAVRWPTSATTVRSMVSGRCRASSRRRCRQPSIPRPN